MRTLKLYPPHVGGHGTGHDPEEAARMAQTQRESWRLHEENNGKKQRSWLFAREPELQAKLGEFGITDEQKRTLLLKGEVEIGD